MLVIADLWHAHYYNHVNCNLKIENLYCFAEHLDDLQRMKVEAGGNEAETSCEFFWHDWVTYGRANELRFGLKLS